MATNKQNKNNFWQKTVIVISLLLFTQVISPFLKPGLFLGHDSQLHTIYLVKFENALKDGQFPVRWTDWFIPGFNQPLFNFYQPGVYYFYQIPRSLGFGNVASLNILAVSLWLLSALLMFLFARLHAGKLGGLLAAYFYLLAPYHIVDIFVRSALPEFSALSFIPGIFWGLKAFSGSGKGVYLGLISLFTALTLISHPPTLIMFSPLIALYMLYLSWSKVAIPKALNFAVITALSVITGFGLVAFFIIPAFLEQPFIQTIYLRSGYYDIHHHFVCLTQPFLPFWGYGTSAKGCDDGMSFQLGLVHWLSIVFTFAILCFKYYFKKSPLPKKMGLDLSGIPEGIYYLLLIFCGVFIAAFYLLFEISEPIWTNTPYLAYLQYSWRFLAVLTFIASFFAGAALVFFKTEKIRYWVFVILMLLVTMAYGNYLKPAGYETGENADFGNKIQHEAENLKNFDPEPGYMPKWTHILPPKNRLIASEIEFEKEGATLNSFNLKSNYKEYQFELKENSNVRFQTHYYPGWKVILNNSEVTPNYENIYGFMDLNIPSGKHTVVLKLEETTLRKTANLLSLVFVLVAILSVGFGRFYLKKLPV